MRKIAVLLFLLLVSSVAAAERARPSSVYIVRLKGGPVSNLVHKPVHRVEEENDEETRNLIVSHTSNLRQQHDSFLGSLLEEGSYEKLYSYTYLLNAFAVKLTSDFQAESIKAHPDVVSVEQETFFQRTTTYTPQFLGVNPTAWNINGGVLNAGSDIVIGVLDTGIYPQHSCFSNTSVKYYSSLQHWSAKCEVCATFPKGACNGKIVGARHFSKGIVAANAFNSSNDYDSPLDGDGHGTHTSSVAAGNNDNVVFVSNFIYGKASGMAPRARIAAYKVVYRDGGYLSDVLAGIDQAVQDGVHILSISLGSTSGAYGVPFLNSFDIMMLLALKSNVLVVHAAGNNGPAAFSMNSFGPWILSVAASSTDRTYSVPILLGNGHWVYGLGLTAGTSPANKMYSLVYAADAYLTGIAAFDAEYYSYCPDPTPFNRTIIRGNILICNFVEYVPGGAVAQLNAALQTAKDMQAAGILVVSQATTEKTRGASFDPVPFDIPAAFVLDSNASAEIFLHYNRKTSKDSQGRVLNFGAQARIEDSRKATYPQAAPRVMSYSSRGPVYADTVTSLIADIMKPDILAPGNQIWGAWPPSGVQQTSFSGERFALLSGTSMATPHIAGIVALVRQKYPTWSVSAVRSAVMTTANVLDNRMRTLKAEQAYMNASAPISRGCPFDYGSGSVNASAALDPGLVFDVGFQDYVNFLCLIPGADKNSVEYSTGASCANASGAPSNLNMPYVAVANLIGKRVVRRTVVNMTPRTEFYNVTIRHPEGVQVVVSPRMFNARPGKPVDIDFTFTATQTNQQFSFGYVIWNGSFGHSVRLPLLVSANSMSG